MTQGTDSAAAPLTCWLGFDSPFPQTVPRAVVGRTPPEGANVFDLFDPFGESCEREATAVRLWRDDVALYVEARCATAAMDRVRTLAARETPYGRDEWGGDALELQIDVGRTMREYRHLILQPNGLAVTYLGFNNRHVQGWHPRFAFRVTMDDSAWHLALTLPFEMLGTTPRDGDVWGLNITRVNASEARGYVQWSPTFGDALRPELFGELRFTGRPSDRRADAAAYARRAAEHRSHFLTHINNIREPDALRALALRGFHDWRAWGEHMKTRPGPASLRWEGCAPGVNGIPTREHALIIAEADALTHRIATWSVASPDPASFGIATLEVLGDAWLLRNDPKYVHAFDAAIRVNAALMRNLLPSINDPHDLHYSTNPYHDIQVVNTAIAAHAYITLSRAGLEPETHAVMMWHVLRAGRFAAYNIRSAYNAGNHQVYESGGLASVAALFPEMPDSEEWAAVASRSIRLHLDREVYPDGGYFERCGYHSVALSFTMHAVALILLNHAEQRFPELMSQPVQTTLQRMHDWLLWLNAPDGTFPAFGDCGESSHLCFLQRGAAIYNRADLAWPLHQLDPAMVPPGLTPRQPAQQSISLASHFTVMRDGWSPDSFYIAVDHGPLGGQHSHPDTLGFVAYAHGHPVALDAGIGTTYEDKRYGAWFRTVRAHNTIVIDDIEPEKIAEQTAWLPGEEIDVLAMRSLAYQHALGVVHHRTIHFIKRIGWFIHDRLIADDERTLTGRAIGWVLHTPYALQSESPGHLHATLGDTGLLVIATHPTSPSITPGSPAKSQPRADLLEEPRLTTMPSAVPLPTARSMRLWDTGRRHNKELTQPITQLSLRHKPTPSPTRDFAVLLLPYRGHRPEVIITPHNTGWHLRVGDRAVELTTPIG